jgi:hypothetical protein
MLGMFAADVLDAKGVDNQREYDGPCLMGVLTHPIGMHGGICRFASGRTHGGAGFVLVGRVQEGSELQRCSGGRMDCGVCCPEGMWRKVVVLLEFCGWECSRQFIPPKRPLWMIQ